MRTARRTNYSAVFFFVFTLLIQAGLTSAQTAQTLARSTDVRTEKFLRTELYFGRSIPGGGFVSEDDWDRFLAEIVTPRFPDGFTSLKAIGQYREKGGRIVTEPSGVLIFLYSSRHRNASRVKIEEIRAAYIKMFNQESVLRVDLPRSVRVSF